MRNDHDSEPEDSRRQRVALWASLGILLLGILVTGILRWTKTAPEQEFNGSEMASPLAQIRKALRQKIKPPEAKFTDITESAGIDWIQVNGATGKKYFPEAMGTGVAWIDWDNDLDPDLILVNATRWPEDAGQERTGYITAFENDGLGNFTDVTDALGLKVSLYGTGIATGDFDGDGFTDVYVTALGTNELFRNIGGKRFENVTESMGVAGSKQDYSTCAGFFDADGDGDLDLIVGNYAVWNLEVHQQVMETVPGVGVIYNDPDAMEGQFGRIYRNDGEQGFVDMSDAWGVTVKEESVDKPVGKNLGFGFGYFNDDRVLDVVVANDQVRNLFLVSRPSLGFDERGREAGLAYDRRGESSAAMGIDIDRDVAANEFRVVVGNFFDEMTSLYINAKGTTSFVDESVAEGIGPRTNARVTFGALFVDYDNDGYRDIFEVNGAIQEIPPKLFGVGEPYRQPGDIFWHCGNRCKTTYVYLGKTLSGDFGKSIAGRGLAAADMDGDGDLDLIATSVKGPVSLYRNDTISPNNWLRIKLKGRSPNSDAIGAEVILTTGDHVQYRLVQPSRSYLSANELVQTFGLGAWDESVSVEVIWPSGRSQKHIIDEVNRLVIFNEPG